MMNKDGVKLNSLEVFCMISLNLTEAVGFN